MNETINLLLNHMSIRRYKDKPVDRETVNTIIKCAQMAPTSSHFQAYTIIEIQDSAKREFLAKAAGDQRWIKEAPLVLLFCGDLHRGKEYFEGADPEVFSNTESYTVAVVDAAIAMQKALIAAQSLGLGGVVAGGIRNDVEGVAKEFKLPELVCPLFALCLGYPDEVPGTKPRLPQEEIHKIDYYDESNSRELIDKYNQEIKDYYTKRTNGKAQDRWTERCGRLLMAKTRDEVGCFLRKIGFLKR
ncbi:MAG: Oxygen-insensitive nitroreductase [Clostridia bacterium]|jgi:nitroreductase/FMN reductase (NADPH)|nr:Oxygen-insensitive nitroreductase [Clostridia bacterium]